MVAFAGWSTQNIHAELKRQAVHKNKIAFECNNQHQQQQRAHLKGGPVGVKACNPVLSRKRKEKKRKEKKKGVECE